MSGQEPTPQPVDPTQMRISDADRNAVAELLRTAAGDGRLDFDELDQRLESTWAAKVYADLPPIVADLPGTHPTGRALEAPASLSPAPRPPAPVSGSPTVHQNSVAVLSSAQRKGEWTVGDSYTAVSVLGSVELDFRSAAFCSSEVVVTCTAILGSVEITVNAGTQVINEVAGVLGEASERNKVLPVLSPESPVLRVKGMALLGSVEITRREMPGEPKPPRLPKHQR